MWKYIKSEWKTYLLLLVVSIFFSYKVSTIYYNSLPITDWFQVNQIAVQTTTVGQEPNILYDREIKKPFRATYTVRLERVSEDNSIELMCTGSDTVDYKTNTGIPSVVTLTWFLGHECNVYYKNHFQSFLPIGQYRLTVTWRIFRLGYEEVELEAHSNLFTIKPLY